MNANHLILHMLQFQSDAIDQFLLSNLDIARRKVVAADEEDTLNQVIDKLIDAERKVDWAFDEIRCLQERVKQVKKERDALACDATAYTIPRKKLRDERDLYKKRVHELEEQLAQIKLKDEGIKGD